MALKTVRNCDVYEKSTKEVCTYQVMIERVSDDGDSVVVGNPIQIDLCPRAKKRLDGFILKGTSPPSHRVQK